MLCLSNYLINLSSFIKTWKLTFFICQFPIENETETTQGISVREGVKTRNEVSKCLEELEEQERSSFCPEMRTCKKQLQPLKEKEISIHLLWPPVPLDSPSLPLMSLPGLDLPPLLEAKLGFFIPLLQLAELTKTLLEKPCFRTFEIYTKNTDVT